MVSKNSRKARKAAKAAADFANARATDLCNNCAWNADARWIGNGPCDNCEDQEAWVCEHKKSAYCEHPSIHGRGSGSYCVDIRWTKRCPVGVE